MSSLKIVGVLISWLSLLAYFMVFIHSNKVVIVTQVEWERGDVTVTGAQGVLTVTATSSPSPPQSPLTWPHAQTQQKL